MDVETDVGARQNMIGGADAPYRCLRVNDLAAAAGKKRRGIGAVDLPDIAAR